MDKEEKKVEAPAVEAPAKKAPVKEEMITVKKATIEKMLARLDRVEAAASRSQLAHFDSKHVGEQTKQASISEYNGKIVVAWSMTEDLIDKINGVWVEKQTIELTYMDDEKEKVPAKSFWLQHRKRAVEVLSEKKLSTGEVIWEVATVEAGSDESITLTLDITFIN